jgi:hypothetical protein
MFLSLLIYSFLYKITNEEINITKDINISLIQSNNKVIIIEIEFNETISHSIKITILLIKKFILIIKKINLNDNKKINLIKQIEINSII